MDLPPHALADPDGGDTYPARVLVDEVDVEVNSALFGG